MKYGDAGLQIRRLDVGYQSPFETGDEPVCDTFNVFGRTVGAYDYLFLRVVQGVEGPEKFFLRLLLAGDELHVVYHQHVKFAVPRAEFLIGVVPDRGDQVVSELFRTDIKYFRIIIRSRDMMSDGVHKVRLAKSDLPPDEERIVGISGRLGDRQACGVRKPV